MYKRIVCLAFLLVLMIPTSIQILHELDSHTHTICVAVGEKHIHEYNNNCDIFHKQQPNFSVDFTTYLEVIPSHLYSIIFIDEPNVFKKVYRSKKSTRAPPYFTV